VGWTLGGNDHLQVESKPPTAGLVMEEERKATLGPKALRRVRENDKKRGRDLYSEELMNSS